MRQSYHQERAQVGPQGVMSGESGDPHPTSTQSALRALSLSPRNRSAEPENTCLGRPPYCSTTSRMRWLMTVVTPSPRMVTP